MLRLRGPEVAPGTLYVRPSRRILGAEFGREELRHVVFGSLALTLIFAGAFARNRTAFGGDFPATFVAFLPVSAVAAIAPFFLAMVVQKRVAEKQGCTTEFRVLPQWMIVSVLFAFLFGFVFAAPGATSRFGNVTRAGVGKISAAVPMCYIGVGFAALMAALVLGAPGTVGLLLVFTARTTGVLAAFSMIPVPGFPGADIWRWSKLFFGLLLGSAAALYWLSLAGLAF